MGLWNKFSRCLKCIVLAVMLLASPPVWGAEEAAFQETLLDIQINGAPAAFNVLLLQHPNGSLSARISDLQAWRLVMPAGASFFYLGEEYFPLDAFPGLTYTMDPATLVLTIEVLPELFDVLALRRYAAERLVPQSGTGAYLNYDLNLNLGQNQSTSFNGLFEAVFFADQGFGALVNSFIVRAGGDGAEVVRLTNTWTKDLVGKRQSIRVGDSTTPFSQLSPGLNFGGIQWSTNFSLDPTYITAPLNTIGGLADQPSVIEVFINNVLRSTEEVPTGPFLLDIPGTGTGRTDIRILVTDVLGRQRLIDQSLYLAPTLLGEGISQFSVQAGLERENFALKSFDYGSAFISGAYRHGFSNQVTGEAYGAITEDLGVVGLGADMVVSDFGQAGGFVLASHGDHGSGLQAGVSLQFVESKFNFSIRSIYASPNFRQLGLNTDTQPAKFINSAGFGMRVGSLGGFSISVVHRDNRSGDDQVILFSTQSLNFRFGTLALDSSVSFTPTREFAIAIRLILPFSPRDTVTASASRNSGRNAASLEYRRSLGFSDVGIAYRVRAETNDGRQTFDGGLAWQNKITTVVADISNSGGRTRGSVGVAGAIGFMGGKLFLTRRIDGGFAVVDTGGIEGITVYLENRAVGKTDGSGRIYIPGLGAYRANSIRLETSEIPFDAAIGDDKIDVVPYFRSGVLVEFPIEVVRSATITVVDEFGSPLPPGLQVQGDKSKSEGIVGFEGFTYLTGLGAGEVRFSVPLQEGECSFILEVPAKLEFVPDLGEVICR